MYIDGRVTGVKKRCGLDFRQHRRWETYHWQHLGPNVLIAFFEGTVSTEHHNSHLNGRERSSRVSRRDADVGVSSLFTERKLKV